MEPHPRVDGAVILIACALLILWGATDPRATRICARAVIALMFALVITAAIMGIAGEPF